MNVKGRSSNSGSVTIVTATKMRLLLLVSLSAILLQLHGGAADRGINPNTGKWCKGCKIRICSGAPTPTRGRHEGCANYCNVSCSRGGPRWIKQAYVGRWWRDEMMILLENGKMRYFIGIYDSIKILFMISTCSVLVTVFHQFDIDILYIRFLRFSHQHFVKLSERENLNFKLALWIKLNILIQYDWIIVCFSST